MKNLMILMVLISTMAFTACGQKSKVPAKVKTAFAQKFQNVKNVSWDKENATEWEGEFKMNGKAYSANFDNNGVWKETEYEIEKSAIPANVKQTLDREFAGYDIKEAEISETAEGKVYELAIKQNKTKLEVAISPDGKVVKKESGDEDND